MYRLYSILSQNILVFHKLNAVNTLLKNKEITVDKKNTKFTRGVVGKSNQQVKTDQLYSDCITTLTKGSHNDRSQDGVHLTIGPG